MLGQSYYGDASSSRHFVREYGIDLHYSYERGKWFYYQQGVWNLDQRGYVIGLVKKFSDSIGQASKQWLAEAKAAGDKDEIDRAEAFCRYAKTLSHLSARKSVLEDSQSEEGISILLNEMNQHPMLLNCPNGVIDLTTGDLLPHSRDYLFSHGLDIPYDPDAKCPRWEQFILEIMGGPLGPESPEYSASVNEARSVAEAKVKELVEYLQRLLGYCLTGCVDDQILPIFFGNGSNGKSVLIIMMLKVLGTLGKKATRELLTVKRGETHPTEITDLFGKRFVVSSELEQHQELAAALSKDATGGEEITGRRMREDFWSFKPTHKIILSTNYKPRVKDMSHAMWRRIQAVPFTVTFLDEADCTQEMLDDPTVPKKDKQLVAKLSEELPGILAWLVRGCLEWQRIGIKPPQEVALATAEYRSQQDVIEQFFESECLLGSQYQTNATDLFSAFKTWAEDSNERQLTKRDFSTQLDAKGYKKKHTNKGDVWQEIGLKDYKRDEGGKGNEGEVGGEVR
jgi:putative DNA primase/helicase